MSQDSSVKEVQTPPPVKDFDESAFQSTNIEISASFTKEEEEAKAKALQETSPSVQNQRKQADNAYTKKAYVLQERLDELRKYINEKTEIDETEE